MSFLPVKLRFSREVSFNRLWMLDLLFLAFMFTFHWNLFTDGCLTEVKFPEEDFKGSFDADSLKFLPTNNQFIYKATKGKHFKNMIF